jgi:hypothetical protein
MYCHPPQPKIFERWGFGGRKLFIKSFLPPILGTEIAYFYEKVLILLSQMGREVR